MANWKHSINVAEDWRAAKRGELKVSELAGRVAAKLRGLRVSGGLGDDLREIIDEFEDIAADPLAEDLEFNQVWERLYDWGDTELPPRACPPNKLCWIGTL